MTDTPHSTLVVKNAAGNYFLVPMETVEQGRVPTDQHAELERQVAEAAGDVQGFIGPIVGGLAFGVGMCIGFELASEPKVILGNPLTGIPNRPA